MQSDARFLHLDRCLREEEPYRLATFITFSCSSSFYQCFSTNRFAVLGKNLWKSGVDDGSVGIRLRSLNRYRATNQRTLLSLLKRLR